MIDTIPRTSKDIASISEKFDDRSSAGLSNWVVKRGGDADQLNYEHTAPLKIIKPNKSYFQQRISTERELLNKDPNNIKLLLRVGDIYLANKKPDKARQYYQRAFRIDTDNTIVAKKLVEAYMAKGMHGKADQVLDLVGRKLDYHTTHLHAVIKMIVGNIDSSETIIKSIPVTSPNFYEAINTLGLLYLTKGQFDKAKKCFASSIDANDDYVPAKSNFALSLERLGQTDKATIEYTKVTTDHREYLVARQNLYNLFVREGRIKDAYDLMVSVRDLSTAENEIQFRIAWCLMTMGHHEEAIKEYSVYLKQAPNNVAALNNIGHCYAETNNEKEALSHFDLAVKYSKQGPNVDYIAYRNLMVMCDRVGEVKRSRRIASDILKTHPDDVFACVYKGNELVDQQRYDEAYDYLIKAYKHKPPLAALYVSLSFIYADILPDYEKGIEACEFAISKKLDKTPAIINNYAHLHLIFNKLPEASKIVAGLEEKYPVNLATKALYELKMGNVKKAEKIYDRAVDLVEAKHKNAFYQRKYFDLANYYESNNDNEPAASNYQKVLDYSEGAYAYIKEMAETKLEEIS